MTGAMGRRRRHLSAAECTAVLAPALARQEGAVLQARAELAAAEETLAAAERLLARLEVLLAHARRRRPATTRCSR